jgi:RNA polymerase sigma factor (sigma-70 family)
VQENTVERLLLEKNEQGMDALLLHYGPLMRYIIAPILQNPQDREDCLSEVSMRVWEKIGQFDGEKGSFHAWLTAITRNTALNHARKASGSSAEELSESTPSPELSPEEALLKKERQEALKTALSRLSYKDRLLFYRKYYYRQSTAQIAAELGMTERAVEGKLYRVKKQLRKSLGGEACE